MQACEDALRRTEQRALVLQLERLMGYPIVRRQVEAGKFFLHGWHSVIEEGEVHVFDVERGRFVPASEAERSGTGPYRSGPVEKGIFNEIAEVFGSVG